MDVAAILSLPYHSIAARTTLRCYETAASLVTVQDVQEEEEGGAVGVYLDRQRYLAIN